MEIIDLKAPGNSSDQFWFNPFPILWLARQESPISMISGFGDPCEPLFIGLNIPKILSKIWEKHGDILKIVFSVELRM